MTSDPNQTTGGHVMTLRMKLADWISGGAISEYLTQAFRSEIKASVSRIALRQIAAMETPYANATVQRMAKTAREALEE